MYIAVLESAVGRRQKPLARFPINILHVMRMYFPHEDDRFDIALVLNYIASLLSGVTDHKNPAWLLHT